MPDNRLLVIAMVVAAVGLGCESKPPPGKALLSASPGAPVAATLVSLDGVETNRRRIELAPGRHSVVVQLETDSIEGDLIVSRVARCQSDFEAHVGERYTLAGTLDAGCRVRILRARDTSPVGECGCTAETHTRPRRREGGGVERDSGPPILPPTT